MVMSWCAADLWQKWRDPLERYSLCNLWAVAEVVACALPCALLLYLLQASISVLKFITATVFLWAFAILCRALDGFLPWLWRNHSHAFNVLGSAMHGVRLHCLAQFNPSESAWRDMMVLRGNFVMRFADLWYALLKNLELTWHRPFELRNLRHLWVVAVGAGAMLCALFPCFIQPYRHVPNLIAIAIFLRVCRVLEDQITRLERAGRCWRLCLLPPVRSHIRDAVRAAIHTAELDCVDSFESKAERFLFVPLDEDVGPHCNITVVSYSDQGEELSTGTLRQENGFSDKQMAIHGFTWAQHLDAEQDIQGNLTNYAWDRNDDLGTKAVVRLWTITYDHRYKQKQETQLLKDSKLELPKKEKLQQLAPEKQKALEEFLKAVCNVVSAPVFTRGQVFLSNARRGSKNAEIAVRGTSLQLADMLQKNPLVARHYFRAEVEEGELQTKRLHVNLGICEGNAARQLSRRKGDQVLYIRDGNRPHCEIVSWVEFLEEQKIGCQTDVERTVIPLRLYKNLGGEELATVKVTGDTSVRELFARLHSMTGYRPEQLALCADTRLVQYPQPDDPDATLIQAAGGLDILMKNDWQVLIQSSHRKND